MRAGWVRVGMQIDPRGRVEDFTRIGVCGFEIWSQGIAKLGVRHECLLKQCVPVGSVHLRRATKPALKVCDGSETIVHNRWRNSLPGAYSTK